MTTKVSWYRFRRIPSKVQNFVQASARFVCPLRPRGEASLAARIITANAIIAEREGRIALLTIYDKEDASSVKLNVIKQMTRELGVDV